MVISRDQNAGQIQSIKTDNSSFERVEEFRYFGTTLPIQNSIQEDIKSRLKSEMLSFGAEYFAFQFDIQKFND